MYEYKVLVLSVKESDEALNRFAKEGWRLVTASPNMAMGHGLVITLERKIAE